MFSPFRVRHFSRVLKVVCHSGPLGVVESPGWRFYYLNDAMGKIIIRKSIAKLFLPALSCALMAGCSSDNVDRQVNHNNPRKSLQDESVHKAMTEYFNNASNVGAIVGVSRDNVVSWYAYGETEKGAGKLPDEKTIFEIGSVTKTFTAALITQWLAEKKLDIDSPVAPYLPAKTSTGLSKDNKSVTFRQLLDYSNGLPEDGEISDLKTTQGFSEANPFMHYDSTLFYRYLEKNQLRNVPGTTYKYSNMAFGLAGLVLARNTGKSFEKLVSERISTPLKLEDTGVTLTSSQEQRMAKGYGRGGAEVARWKSIGGFESAGILVSSASDMIRYGRAQLLKDHNDLTHIFEVTQKASFTYKFSGTTIKNGLGWVLFDASVGGGGVVKTGATGGFSSFLLVAPAKNMVITVLFNNNNGGAAEDAASKLAASLLGS